jgi:hypothetical protein
MIDRGHSEGKRDRLRIRSSWSETVSIAGRGEVSERVRIGCDHFRADHPFHLRPTRDM